MTKGKLTVEVQNHTYLTSALLGTEWSTTPQALYQGKLEGGPIADLNDFEKRQSLVPVWNRTPLPVS
jgi:hypothetical protein